MRKFTSDRLLVATHNSGKLEEIAELLRPYGVAVTGAAQMALPVPEETEETFVGNARIKAHAAAKATGLPALADDSGVQVDGLGGAPGVHTADWAETESGRDFPMAMQKVHDMLRESNAPQPWTARFVSTLVIAWPDGHDEAFEGIMPGQIVWPPRGENGHGYDPIFQPTGRDTTFAEMETSEKNRISHRAEAFRKLVEECFT
ncbi:non-canonical purine NTP pyrophosphatase [Haematobacter massiliensis]|uniref:dITP/XTP pyrophosphatase n=1 Tax=Haematobacter massiliensis TaxID=195105 RepID=A0A086Y0X9_9RHOB|nr:RdgB/HAM1 family non-canonical purine NTP pyrophosphatase [Haematobacter massiliensis]KFI27929.1 nucleoside-triphosphate diphosphatase [Haematobacter massiliensis]OWJ69993.1 non-canonical purine NTP pyrophosphatase [Haematobacter massiliensis]OWJ87121.1 non-canonical purine NTP pyrophosphatase [Haematobacter massiliensis]QBJ23090.1 RdgB/HAM1 family non-canonical purine NTP pyrophosphatase [Haematobacter massiliensis]